MSKRPLEEGDGALSAASEPKKAKVQEIAEVQEIKVLATLTRNHVRFEELYVRNLLNEGNNDADDNAAGDDAAKDDVYAVDDANYYAKGDDTLYYDDANANNGDDGGNAKYVNTDDQVKYNYAAHDDDFYNFDDDGNRRRLRKLDTLDASHSLTAVETRKVRHNKNFLCSCCI